jgi:flagellin
MRINNNLMAMNTHRQLGLGNTAASKSMEKLSSGYRINRAGDDAAGLSISEKMRGQIRGLMQASSNAQDGISLIQTAEGALQETHAILQRMRELAVQSANDTNVDVDRAAIQGEIDELAAEITRIAENTEFNTQNLLGGKFEGKFHIGANAKQNVSLSINDMSASALQVAGPTGASFAIKVEKEELSSGEIAAYLGEGTYNVVALDEGTKVGGKPQKYALVDADGKVCAVSENGKAYKKLATASDIEMLDTANLAEGAADNYLEFDDYVISGKVVVEVTPATDSESNDGAVTATATATVETKLANDTYTVVEQPEGDEYLLVNSDGKVVAKSEDDGEGGKGKVWKDVNSLVDDPVLETATALEVGAEITVGSNGGLNVSTQKSADKAITIINNALEAVSKERSKLGAMQNRLEHTIRNLDTSAENLQASESRIRDADIAKEMMEFTKNSILQQAAQAMLAQANQAPQGVLQLLR